MKRIIAIILWITVVVLIVLCILRYLVRSSRQDEWKKETTPLPTETVKLLCNSFELSPDNSLCNGTIAVYSLDFVQPIRDTFRPYEAYNIPPSEAATFEEVEKKIGIYKLECEPVVYQADGLDYFRCSYDLRGDRKFVLTFFYTYPDMAVIRITSTSRFDE